MMQDNHVYFQFYFKSWKPNVITKQDFMWRQVTPSSAPAGSGTPPWPWPPWLVWPRGQSSWRSTSSWSPWTRPSPSVRGPCGWRRGTSCTCPPCLGGDSVLDVPRELLLIGVLVLLDKVPHV